MSLTIVIGASGAIGLELIRTLVRKKGPKKVIAALHKSPLPRDIEENVICEFGIDVRFFDSLLALMEKYKDDGIECVWQLAAPLSVATAEDPTYAESVTVGGMENVLKAMEANGVRKILFSDSIGSFGTSSPRESCTAKWLIENPMQDPGSDYGKQKRRCRELLKEFASEKGFDTRFAVIPGVLHGKLSYGKGTTEYALDAILSAVKGELPYECPIPLETKLPMVHVEDLVEGLCSLQDAPRENLKEPEAGYNMAGFSFTPLELFEAINEIAPELQFSFVVNLERNPAALKFAQTWPDSLSDAEGIRDLQYKAFYDLHSTVRDVIAKFKNGLEQQKQVSKL